jgi:lysozyme
MFTRVGLATSLLAALALLVGCSATRVAGKYVSQANPEDYLELRTDGTFYLQEEGITLDGKYRVDGDDITLSVSILGISTASKGRLEGDVIIDQDGERWVKKSSSTKQPALVTPTTGGGSASTPTEKLGSGNAPRQTSMEAAKLFAEYDANLISAESKYVGNTVVVRGTIRFSRDYDHLISLTERVNCFFDASGPEEAFFHVVPGQSVVLKGVVKGRGSQMNVGNVVDLDRCAFATKPNILDEPIQGATTATQLYAGYASDQKAVTAKYQGQVIALTGEVSDLGLFTQGIGVRKDYSQVTMSFPYVSIKSGGAWDIVCLFPHALKPQLVALTKQQQIGVKGRFDPSGSPFRNTPMLRDCTLIPPDVVRQLIPTGTLIPTLTSTSAPSPPESTKTGTNALSVAGLRFIAQHEGFRPTLYDDPAEHCTIGYGHLVHRGMCDSSEPEEFRRSGGISEQRASELLKADAEVAQRAVNTSVTVPMNQAQFDALVSFVYNLGEGNLRESDLLKKLNAGDYDAVPEELNRWVFAGEQKLAGLVERRRDEGVLFKEGRYGASATSAVGPTVPGPTGASVREPPPVVELQPIKCELHSSTRSSEGGSSTTILFTNQTRQTVYIYRHPANYESLAYMRLEPGEEDIQQTYFGHPWVVYGASKCLAIYQPSERPARAVIP